MPKPKRIRNFLKSNDQRQPTLIPNDQGPADDFPEVMSSTPIVDDESSESPNKEPLELPNQTSSQPAQLGSQRFKPKVGRKSTHYWFVEAKGFDKWSDMPEDYFNDQWTDVFQMRFCFKVNEDMAKRYVEQSIGKKWREYKLKLWNEFYDPTLTKSEIIKNFPEGVSKDHWALYVEYRLKPATMEFSKRNREIRKKQIPHTCGAKSLARRKNEWKIETDETIGRCPLWNITHKRKDGSYVNGTTLEIGEKINNNVSQSS